MMNDVIGHLTPADVVLLQRHVTPHGISTLPQTAEAHAALGQALSRLGRTLEALRVNAGGAVRGEQLEIAAQLAAALPMFGEGV